jgi:hypothetical protein
MNESQIERLFQVLERLTQALELLCPEKKPPNYIFPLENFKEFDWESIGATVDKWDQYGAAIVVWNDRRYTRRSPENVFGSDIYFSRSIGKDESGRNVYERLVKFQPLSSMKVRPISRDAESII